MFQRHLVYHHNSWSKAIASHCRLLFFLFWKTKSCLTILIKALESCAWERCLFPTNMIWKLWREFFSKFFSSLHFIYHFFPPMFAHHFNKRKLYFFLFFIIIVSMMKLTTFRRRVMFYFSFNHSIFIFICFDSSFYLFLVYVL